MASNPPRNAHARNEENLSPRHQTFQETIHGSLSLKCEKGPHFCLSPRKASSFSYLKTKTLLDSRSENRALAEASAENGNDYMFRPHTSSASAYHYCTMIVRRRDAVGVDRTGTDARTWNVAWCWHQEQMWWHDIPARCYWYYRLATSLH